MTLHNITDKITKAEKNAGREAGAVSLIAVSKVQPNARVQSVLDEGRSLRGDRLR